MTKKNQIEINSDLDKLEIQTNLPAEFRPLRLRLLVSGSSWSIIGLEFMPDDIQKILLEYQNSTFLEWTIPTSGK